MMEMTFALDIQQSTILLFSRFMIYSQGLTKTTLDWTVTGFLRKGTAAPIGRSPFYRRWKSWDTSPKEVQTKSGDICSTITSVTSPNGRSKCRENVRARSTKLYVLN